MIKMMSTGGPLIPNKSCKMQQWGSMKDGYDKVLHTFQFPLLYKYEWHYDYHHVDNNQNNLHHLLLSGEHTMAGRCMCSHSSSWYWRGAHILHTVSFVSLILSQLANSYATNLYGKNKQVCAIHQLIKTLPHAIKFAPGRWVCTVKLRYQDYPHIIKK